MNTLLDGSRPCSNFAEYSKNLTTRYPQPHRNVSAMNNLNRAKFFACSDAHDITIVTLDAMSTIVLIVASGTFRMSAPCSHFGEPARSST